MPASKKKTIRNRCIGTKTVPVSHLSPFQGNLKTLDKQRYEKLKHSIERRGFIAPVFIWREKILDGHQRLFVLKDMIKDGFEIEGGEVPIVEIDAASEKEAREFVLSYASRFGKVSDTGFADFAVDLDVEMIATTTEIPEIYAQLRGYDPDGEIELHNGEKRTQQADADVVFVIKMTYEQADKVGEEIRKLCRDNAVEIDIS